MNATTPFPYGCGPTTEAERTANYEANSAQLNKALADEATAMDTREAILNLMGAWSEGMMAKREVMALLNRHEANLRRAWEHGEMGLARQRAEEAIRGAIRANMEGKLI